MQEIEKTVNEFLENGFYSTQLLDMRFEYSQLMYGLQKLKIQIDRKISRNQ